MGGRALAGTVRDFRELRVYQAAFAAAADIHQLSKKWPSEERYSLTDQIRRSSRSVCANIAEAWRKRRYKAAFVSRLSDAESEAAETQVWIEFAVKCGYLSRDGALPLYQTYDDIERMDSGHDSQTGAMAHSGGLKALPLSRSPTLPLFS